jgi:nitronate monooxygenase
MRPVLRTKLCELLGIEYPIILAGMGGVARAELVAAVSNAGGLGVIGATGMRPERLRQEIRKVRDLTDRPFGVDILLPVLPSEMGRVQEEAPQGPRRSWRDLLTSEHHQFMAEMWERFRLPPLREDLSRSTLGRDFGPDYIRRQMEVVLEEGVPVFASGLGNPAPFVPELHRSGAKVIALVGNVKNALRVREGGADIIVAQGHEAGGHTGRIGTMALVPQVVDAVAPTPVVAAGGIGDGRGLAAALCLGAVGVWVGTAFLVSEEAHLDPDLKRRILEASEEDTRVTRIYTGKTARVINNPLLEEWERRGLPTLPFPYQGGFMAQFLAAARDAGRKELLMNAAGQVCGMLRQVRPAREIVEEMVAQAVEALSEALPKEAQFSS